MWIESILDSWIDFITMIIGFSVAIIGILTKTTNEGKKWPNNITVFGWILVFFAIINLSFSLYQSYKNIENKKKFVILYFLKLSRQPVK